MSRAFGRDVFLDRDGRASAGLARKSRDKAGQALGFFRYSAYGHLQAERL